METRQNTPTAPTPTDVSDADAANKPLTIQQQLWIDYNALGGLITDLTDPRLDKKTGLETTLRKMSITEFARKLDVHRDTLRRWRTEIPNFWDRVNQRRRELAPQGRLQRVHETWYLKAVAGEYGHMVLWLANFDPNFRMPSQEVKHELGDSWVELMKGKKIIEGEVVDDDSAR